MAGEAAEGRRIVADSLNRRGFRHGIRGCKVKSEVVAADKTQQQAGTPNRKKLFHDSLVMFVGIKKANKNGTKRKIKASILL